MSKKLRTRKGNDGYNYPYTHQDLIFNDEGTGLSQQLENFATKDFVNDSISNAQLNNGSGSNPDLSAIRTELEKKANKSDLKAVATSGSYNDLTNKPNIPNIDELINNTISSLTTENKTLLGAINELDENKPDKLIYKDTTTAYKRIDSESSIDSFDMEEGIIFCVIESLNLEEGKTYNVKALVEHITPMSLNEPESLVDNTILIELEGVAEKSEELSSSLGTDVISLSFSLHDYLDEENVIVIYDKVTINSIDSPLSYAEDRAVVAFADNIHYIDIGLKENIESEVTNEFLETYKFVTEEEKINWNNKQDKIKNSVFIKQTPSPDTYDYNEINLVLNTLEDGLYIATNDLSFYDETTLLEGGAELYNGKKECSFDIYAGHLFKYEKVEYNTAYCYITNLTTGIECRLDKNGGIIAIYAANGFMYLDDVEKMLQYEEVVLELYESDRTGTMSMGTSGKEYQFNNAGFLFDENETYHVIFEDLDGKKTEITGKAEDDGMFSGNRILAISKWDNPLKPETYLNPDGTNMTFNIEVKNSLEYNGFGKVTILKIEYVSTEFLETHRFVTEEERQKWNEKADKNYVDGFINSGQINISCIDGYSANILAAHNPNDGFNTIYYSTKAYISSSGSIGTEANMNAKAFYEDGAALIDKYATKTYVDNAIAQASIGGEIDTTEFALKSELFSKDYNDLINKPDIPSIEGLATEELVNNLNNDVVESINEINTELETKASTEFVNNMLSGIRLVQMTQSEYDALEVKDSNTLYIIK